MQVSMVCTIDATGIHAPTYEDVLNELITSFQAIYGADVYLGNDSQDGQLLGVFARAITDSNDMAVAVYNSFSPNSAQGVGLSNAVKINGLARLVPSFSTVDIDIVGDPGTVINNGVVEDSNGVQWQLPASVVIPSGTTITVTATAADIGQVLALPNTLTIIGTPTRGWASANNPAAAVAGNPVESDATLRLRQAASTALPSQTVLDGLRGTLLSLSGVDQVKIYENDTGATDSNGIPAHTISPVVLGGDAVAIAQNILLKKTPGAGTYGTTSETVIDGSGNSNTINFYRPTEVPITIVVTVHNLTGYTTNIATEIIASLVAYFVDYPIGDDVLYTKLYVPANLTGAASATFDLISVEIARTGSPSEANVVIAFNEQATLDASDVTVTVS